MSEEIWKQIDGYDNEVSNLGNFRRASTSGSVGLAYKPDGWSVYLVDGNNGKTFDAGQLVADYFGEPRKWYKRYRLWATDGDFHNIHADNIYWSSENIEPVLSIGQESYCWVHYYLGDMTITELSLKFYVPEQMIQDAIQKVNEMEPED